MRLKLTLLGATAALVLVLPSAAHAGYTVTPSTLAFSDTVMDQKSASQTLTYAIDDDEFFRTTTPAIEGCAPSGFCPFEFTTTCPISPASFPPDGAHSCTFTVTFTPYDVRSFTRNLEIYGQIRTASLTGRGLAPPPPGKGGGKKKGKKCGKKKGKGKTAAAAKKKCGKKKK
jgi:hypothetical protein